MPSFFPLDILSKGKGGRLGVQFTVRPILILKRAKGSHALFFPKAGDYD